MSEQRSWWMLRVMCGAERQLWDIQHDFLVVEQHPLPQTGVGDHFQRQWCTCSSFTPGDWVQMGQSGRVATPHCSLLPDFTPWLSPPGILTQAGPPLVFVTHCSQLYCDRPHFTWLHLDIWSSSGCHLFLRGGGSFTKLGFIICPFVSCISCSTSCDVTD